MTMLRLSELVDNCCFDVDLLIKAKLPFSVNSLLSL